MVQRRENEKLGAQEIATQRNLNDPMEYTEPWDSRQGSRLARLLPQVTGR